MSARFLFHTAVCVAALPLGLGTEAECSETASEATSQRTLLQALSPGNVPSPLTLHSGVGVLQVTNAVNHGEGTKNAANQKEEMFNVEGVSFSVIARQYSVLAEIVEIWPFALVTVDASRVGQVSHRVWLSNLMQVAVMLLALVLIALVASVVYSRSSGNQVSNAVGIGTLYIVTSALMIQTNKWLMLPGKFPYPFALTTNHMFTSFVLANGLRLGWPSAFPSLPKVKFSPWFCCKVLPIGISFALSIVCANGAYGYLSVSFLQIMKQCNVVIVYILSLLVGLETLRRCSCVLLAYILLSTLVAIHGELKFDMVGFLVQVTSSVSEALKIVLQAVLMSGDEKLDPMTMVLFLAPACLVAITPAMVIVDGPRMYEIVAQFKMHWFVILVNASLAFILNVLVAQCIKQMSPVGFLLCGIVKNVSIVVTSAIFLGESLAPSQVVSFIFALSGIAAYSLYKQNQDCFQDDALVTGFSRVAQKFKTKPSDTTQLDSGEKESSTNTK